MAILRTAQVTKLTGLSRVTIWRLERRGDFPHRRQLGRNSVGWLDREIHEWIEGRPRAGNVTPAQRTAAAVQ